MKRLLLAAVVVVAALPAFGDTSYSFTVELARKAGLKFTAILGPKWKTVSAGCPSSSPDCPMQINKVGIRGGTADDMKADKDGKTYDVGFTLRPDGTVQAICLRPICVMKFADVEATMASGGKVDVPLRTPIGLTLKEAVTPAQ